MPAHLVTFEGIDGAGKSSHISWYCDQVRQAGHEVLLTREPGGTPLAETLRDIVLNQDMDDMTELLLVFAARADHVSRVIRPALARGIWVVCDRFVDSTFAYQGGGRGMPTQVIDTLSRWVCDRCEPTRTYWFDVSPEEAQRRRQAVRPADRFEAEQTAFFGRVRDAYLARAEAEPKRVLRVDGELLPSLVREQLVPDLARLLQG